MPSHHSAGWPDLLAQIQQYLIKHDKPKLRGFISFAWETTPDKREFIQTWLTRLQEDLLHAGFADVFLDIKNMSGNLQETMRKGLANSQVIFFICNPRFVARLKEADKERGLGFEVQEVLASVEKRGSALMVLPILQAGTPETSIPKELQAFVGRQGFIDLRGESDVYQKQLTGFMAAEGLITKACQISVQDIEYQTLLRRHYLSTALPEVPTLFGRKDALDLLATGFAAQSVKVLCGEPGVGKSALAMSYIKTTGSSYGFVRYLRVSEEHGWRTALKEFANDLGVVRTKLRATLLKLPSWLVVIDSNNLELPWQKTFPPSSLHQGQNILLVTQASTAPDAIRLSALSEANAVEMVHHYLADNPAQEQQLVAKYAGVPKDLVKAIRYIQQSPWLDLADFLTYDLTPSEPPVRLGATQQDEVQLQAAPPKKWDVLKQDIRDLMTSRPAKTKIGMLSEKAGDALAVTLRQDLTDCDLDVQVEGEAQQFEAINALVIINTPSFKEACEAQEDAILKWDQDKLLPLVVDGEFQEVIPEFLHDYLARPLDLSQQDAYQKMLMGLVNPLGIIPAICNFAAGYKPYEHHWYNYWLSNLPDIGRFVGRTEFLTNIHAKLHELGTPSIIAITGMGGFGKTSVAIRYGETHKADYDLVRVIDSDLPVLHNSLYSFAKDLDIETQGKELRDVLDLLHRELANISNYLLIFDNVEQFAAIKDYLPTLRAGQHIIITSRDDRGVDWPKSIKFAEFTPAEAAEYIREELQEENESLGRELGYLPLALKTALAFIKEKRQQGAYEIADFLRESQASMASDDNPVMKSLKLSLAKIAAHPDALNLLRYCAFLAPGHIVPEWFEPHYGTHQTDGELVVPEPDEKKGDQELGEEGEKDAQEDDNLSESNPDKFDFVEVAYQEDKLHEEVDADDKLKEQKKYAMQRIYDGLMVLANYSMLGVKKKALTIHRLMQEAIRKSITLSSEEVLENYLLPLTEVIRALYPQEKSNPDVYDLMQQLTPHITVLTQHLQNQQDLSVEAQLKNERARAYLLGCLADVYGANGDFVNQRQTLQATLELQRKCCGTQSLEYVNTLTALAETHALLGDCKEQSQCLKEALEIYKQCLDLDNREELYKKTLTDLIQAYELLGESERDQIYTLIAQSPEEIDIADIALSTWQKFPATREQTDLLFPTFLRAIKNGDEGGYRCEDTRETAYEALAKLELSSEQINQRFSAYLTAAKSEHYTVRKPAYEALAKLALSSEQINQWSAVLLTAIKDEDRNLRQDACKALTKLKLSTKQTSQLFSALLTATKDEDGEIRCDAYDTLAELELSKKQSSQRFSALLAATKNGDERGSDPLLAKLWSN